MKRVEPVGPESLRQSLAQVVSEINGALARIHHEEADALVTAILKARRVYTVGVGRSGLVGSCFAMRLVHLGLLAHVVGEATAPGVARGDLVICSSASGKTRTTLAQANAAKTRGAMVAAVTASSSTPLGRIADVTVTIPTAPFVRPIERKRGAAVETEQFGGSLFEQSMLLFYDALVFELSRRLKRSTKQMEIRHANLE